MDFGESLEAFDMRMENIWGTCYRSFIDHAARVQFGQHLSEVPVTFGKEPFLAVFLWFKAIVVKVFDSIAYEGTRVSGITRSVINVSVRM